MYVNIYLYVHTYVYMKSAPVCISGRLEARQRVWQRVGLVNERKNFNETLFNCLTAHTFLRNILPHTFYFYFHLQLLFNFHYTLHAAAAAASETAN